MKCSHPLGCTRPYYQAGWCSLHYSRFLRKGDPGGLDIHSTLPVGAVSCTKSGYTETKISKDSPYRKMLPKGRTRWMFTHRLVMAEHLGRCLLSHEEVHHKNGIHNDNRIENLELWSISQPPGQRVEDKIAWCKEFLAQYGEI